MMRSAKDQPCQTHLNVPSGPPTDPDSASALLPEWRPSQRCPINWSAHTHSPKEAAQHVSA